MLEIPEDWEKHLCDDWGSFEYHENILRVRNQLKWVFVRIFLKSNFFLFLQFYDS